MTGVPIGIELKRSLHGLSQSPALWHNTISMASARRCCQTPSSTHTVAVTFAVLVVLLLRNLKGHPDVGITLKQGRLTMHVYTLAPPSQPIANSAL